MDRPTRNGADGVSRRAALKALGVGAVGVAGVGTVARGGDVLAAVTDGDPGRWELVHHTRGEETYYPPGEHDEEGGQPIIAEVEHRLTYLESLFDPFASPTGTAAEGSWQHTFALSSTAFSVSKPEEGWTSTNAMTGTTINIEVPEEDPWDDDESAYSDDAANPDKVAIGVRRDADLFFFYDPETIATEIDEADEDIMSALTDPPQSYDKAPVEEARAELVQREETTENLAATGHFAVSLGISGLSRLGKISDEASNMASILNLGVSVASGGETAEPDARDYDRAIDESFPIDDHSWGGQYVVFDVFVPPGESGLVRLDSHYDIELENSGGQALSYEHPEDGEVFQPAPSFGIEVSGPPDPRENEVSQTESLTASPYAGNEGVSVDEDHVIELDPIQNPDDE